jgi:hypothetical protein
MDRLVYSFWTGPTLGDSPRWHEKNQLIKNVNIYALSFLFVQKHFKEIVLYTDKLGAELLKTLPFTEVHICFDELTSDDRIWVKGKFLAFEKEKKPFIHLDGDVLITKSTALEKLKNFTSEVIVQGYDNDFHKHYEGQMDYFEKFIKIDRLGYAFNMGIIGFNDIRLKNEYVLEAKRWCKTFLKEETFRVCEKYYEPCIMVEQYNLTNLLHKKNIDPTRMLGNQILDLSVDYCNEIGYIHLTGLQKYGDHYQGMIKTRLEENFPEEYNLLKDNLTNFYDSSTNIMDSTI